MCARDWHSWRIRLDDSSDSLNELNARDIFTPAPLFFAVFSREAARDTRNRMAHSSGAALYQLSLRALLRSASQHQFTA